MPCAVTDCDAHPGIDKEAAAMLIQTLEYLRSNVLLRQ